MEQREIELLIRVETLLDTVVDDIVVLTADVRGNGREGLMARTAVIESKLNSAGVKPQFTRTQKHGGIVAAVLTIGAALAGLVAGFV